jgi:MFS family permease
MASDLALERPMPGSPCPQARWALTSLALSMLMPSLDTSIANAGLPTLAAAFDATFQQVQWIVLAYLLAVTTLIVSVGRLGDVFGRRRLLLIGIGIFTSASLCLRTGAWMGWLIGARPCKASARQSCSP